MELSQNQSSERNNNSFRDLVEHQNKSYSREKEKDGQRHTNKSISFSISSLQSRGGIPKPDPSSHSG